MKEEECDKIHQRSVASPEPHHWRSSSDEPDKPTISAESKRQRSSETGMEKWVDA